MSSWGKLLVSATFWSVLSKDPLCLHVSLGRERERESKIAARDRLSRLFHLFLSFSFSLFHLLSLPFTFSLSPSFTLFSLLRQWISISRCSGTREVWMWMWMWMCGCCMDVGGCVCVCVDVLPSLCLVQGKEREDGKNDPYIIGYNIYMRIQLRSEYERK